jgi:mutator protein MutT
MFLQAVSTIVIVHCQNKFLLVRRALDDDIFPGKWQNAGGKLEPGETIEEAAKRELAEETGISINQGLQFVMSYSWQKAPEDPKRLGIILLADLPGKIENFNIKLDTELCEYGWYTLKETAKLDTIGKDSPTGTLGQIKKAYSMLTS